MKTNVEIPDKLCMSLKSGRIDISGIKMFTVTKEITRTFIGIIKIPFLTNSELLGASSNTVLERTC